MEQKRKNQIGFVDNAVGIKRRNLRDRILALEHYGGLKCACCGEEEFSFLSLDHIVDGMGSSHGRDLFGSGSVAGNHMYRKPRLQGFPDGFRVPCMNYLSYLIYAGFMLTIFRLHLSSCKHSLRGRKHPRKEPSP